MLCGEPAKRFCVVAKRFCVGGETTLTGGKTVNPINCDVVIVISRACKYSGLKSAIHKQKITNQKEFLRAALTLFKTHSAS